MVPRADILLSRPRRTLWRADCKLHWLGCGGLSFTRRLSSPRSQASSDEPLPCPARNPARTPGLRSLLWSIDLQSRHHFLDWRIADGHYRPVHLSPHHRAAWPSAARPPAGTGLSDTYTATIR